MPPLFSSPPPVEVLCVYIHLTADTWSTCRDFRFDFFVALLENRFQIHKNVMISFTKLHYT